MKESTDFDENLNKYANCGTENPIFALILTQLTSFSLFIKNVDCKLCEGINGFSLKFAFSLILAREIHLLIKNVSTITESSVFDGKLCVGLF